MNEKILLQRKTSLINALYPLLVILILILFIYLTGNVKTYMYLSMISFGVIYLYISRYNIVNLLLFENSILIEFYLINKKIKISYEEIIKLKSYSNTYEGLIFRIIFKHENKLYSIRTKFYDKEFVGLLMKKTGLVINR